VCLGGGEEVVVDQGLHFVICCAPGARCLSCGGFVGGIVAKKKDGLQDLV
jgi:hypothetical protein